jgi:hypothetical protein
MKKLTQLLLAVLLISSAEAQNYDDGYVTNGLPVNTGSEKFATLIAGFDEGVSKVEKGEITSNDQVVSIYGLDFSTIQRLDNIVATGNYAAYPQYSPEFLRNLQSVFSRVGTDFQDIYSVRTALRNIPGLTSLNYNEAEALAAIDITIQHVNSRFITSLSSSFVRPFFNSVDQSAGISMVVNREEGRAMLTADTKLPGWAKCVLGILSDGILGTIAGIKVGSAVAGGLGAIVFGVIGGGTGVFTGASKNC